MKVEDRITSIKHYYIDGVSIDRDNIVWDIVQSIKFEGDKCFLQYMPKKQFVAGHLSTRHKARPEDFDEKAYGVKKDVVELGVKETDGKLYYELSWEFIEEIAKRMANNKSDKYPLYNWKKSIGVDKLKQAINRHHIEVMKGNYSDGNEELGHIVAYACGAMMLWEQIKKNI